MQPLLQLYTGAQMKRTQNLALLVVILGAWGLTTVNAQTPNMQGDQMKSSSKMNSNLNNNRLAHRRTPCGHRRRHSKNLMMKKDSMKETDMMKSDSLKSPEMMKKHE